jgi:acid phosphatase family membrane protein YuiD
VMTSEWCVCSALFTSSAISEAGSEAHFFVISCVENVILTFDWYAMKKNVLSVQNA